MFGRGRREVDDGIDVLARLFEVADIHGMAMVADSDEEVWGPGSVPVDAVDVRQLVRDVGDVLGRRKEETPSLLYSISAFLVYVYRNLLDTWQPHSCLRWP